MTRSARVAEQPTQKVRALLCTRKRPLREIDSHLQRIGALEGANLKLSSLLTDAMTTSGRAILQAPTDGERDLDMLLALVRQGDPRRTPRCPAGPRHGAPRA